MGLLLLAGRLPLPAPCRLFICGTLRCLSSSLYSLCLSSPRGPLTPRLAEVISVSLCNGVSGNECDCSDFYRAWEGFVQRRGGAFDRWRPSSPALRVWREVTREPSRKGHFLPVNHILRKEIYRLKRHWLRLTCETSRRAADGVKIMWSS